MCGVFGTWEGLNTVIIIRINSFEFEWRKWNVMWSCHSICIINHRNDIIKCIYKIARDMPKDVIVMFVLKISAPAIHRSLTKGKWLAAFYESLTDHNFARRVVWQPKAASQMASSAMSKRHGRLLISSFKGPDSIQRCRLTSIENTLVEIRAS